MKVTKVLLWITYISFGIIIIAFGIVGSIFLPEGFNAQEREKGNLEGVVSKSTTSKFELPMNLNVEYYFRIKEGELLVDSYFLKIQKKFLRNSRQALAVEKDIDYPVLLQENLFSMPDSESYLYIPISYSSIQAAVMIWKFYFALAAIALLSVFFITIRFLQNCDKGLFFIKANVSYIRIIAYLAIGFSLIDYATQWLVFKRLNNSFSEFPININSALDFNWAYVIASLFLLLIIQAFSEGIKLKEEQSLTI
ncbi:MAG: DUF2975 domain-containing protein [Algoriphagus sp.]|uniref:DUF2975 domain-containing protein n=1 Tax=Algoriphagus sp. TaxID=1872435 RepID=UPI00273008CD|nr:DUF2975 domain-containing protein [Algoriphagus sp.]MDP2039722.1 DUF2975 domain-containing protein [Algoriphagus sp.]MDP3473779.1 DUF2975 domain-containing protein [Algoriphagus sp.]